MASSKVPSPLVVHVMDDAPPPKDPVSVCVDPSHMLASTPALADAAGSTVSVMLSDEDGQPPGGSSVVIVSVTEPFVESLVPGV